MFGIYVIAMNLEPCMHTSNSGTMDGEEKRSQEMDVEGGEYE